MGKEQGTRQVRINLDVWGDEDFLELPVDAQNLYWSLWTSPGRTYCGAHEWHPGRLTQKAGDWTVPRLLDAASVLSRRLFLVIDTLTEECLLRSWIKHDGLWRQPNMAVSVANDRARLASKTLRGVVVHEVQKLKAAEPTLGSWDRDAVKAMLSQKPVDPALLSPFDPGPNGGVDPYADPPVDPYGRNGSDPHADTPPTSTSASTSLTSSTSTSMGGFVNEATHLGANSPTTRPHCNRHPEQNSREERCPDCQLRREWDEAQAAKAVKGKQDLRKTIDACRECDDFGRRIDLTMCPLHDNFKKVS